jgi:hypothetical protein
MAASLGAASLGDVHHEGLDEVGATANYLFE